MCSAQADQLAATAAVPQSLSPPGAAAVTILGWWGGVRWGGGAGWGLDQFHVVGWEHSEVAVRAVAPPPTLVDHLDARDDFIGIE